MPTQRQLHRRRLAGPLAAVIVALCPSCNPHDADALDAQLAEIEQIIRTVPTWNRGGRGEVDLESLPAIDRPAPELEYEWQRVARVELAPTELRIQTSHPSSERLEEGGPRSVSETIAETVDLELGGWRGDASVRVFIHSGVPTANVMTLASALARADAKRLDLVFRRANPPMIERAEPSPELAAALERAERLPIEAFTYPGFIFRDCEIDWEPVAAGPPDLKLRLKREKIVEAVRGWFCDVELNDVLWYYQLDLPETYVHVVPLELGSKDARAVFVDPNATWTSSMSALTEPLDAPGDQDPASRQKVTFVERGTLGRMEIVDVTGPRDEKHLQRLRTLGQLFPKCLGREGSAAPGEKTWKLTITIAADGGAKITALDPSASELETCLAEYLRIALTISPFPSTSGTTTVEAEITVM